MKRWSGLPCRVCGKRARHVTKTDLHGRAEYLTMPCIHEMRIARMECIDCLRPHERKPGSLRCADCKRLHENALVRARVARYRAKNTESKRRWLATEKGRASAAESKRKYLERNREALRQKRRQQWGQEYLRMTPEQQAQVREKAAERYYANRQKRIEQMRAWRERQKAKAA